MKQPIFVRIYHKDQLQSIKQFSGDQIVIGRSPNADVLLDNESVSPIHAVIEERDSGYYISDLGSQSGTFYKGAAVLDQEIVSGDRLSVGEFELEFFVGIPKPTTPPKSESVKVEAPPKIPAEVPAITKEVKPPPIKKDQASDKAPIDEPPSLDVKKPIPGEGVDEEIEKEPSKPSSVDRPFSAADPVVSATPKIQLGSQKGGSKTVNQFSKVKKGATFAPGDQVSDLNKVIRPGKGTIVEVVVAWRGRVLATYHFNEPGTFNAGSAAKNDIVLPLSGGKFSSFPLLVIDEQAKVIIGNNPNGAWSNESSTILLADLIRQNRAARGAQGFEVRLQQGEMLRWDLEGGHLSVFVRYTPETVKPIAAPLLDFTTTEFTGLILAGVISALLGLYVMVYSPTRLADEALLEEPIRRAVIKFNRPKPKVVKIAETTKKQVVKVDMSKKEPTQAPKAKGKPGKAASVKSDIKKKTDKKERVSSVGKGGAIKTGNTKGSNAKSKKKDISKTGLLNVFGSKGMNKRLNQGSNGVGGLAGVANQVTGKSGFDTNRSGDNLGSAFKKTGSGGAGRATEGISGVGTSGKGMGMSGGGTGGLGSRGSVNFNIEGRGAEITGTIDREAIRRVIRKNRRQIKACYDRALNRNRDLYGKLVIEWTIEEKGIVGSAKVAVNELGSRQVGDCIVTRLKTWRFPEPPPNQQAIVQYPFIFQAQ